MDDATILEKIYSVSLSCQKDIVHLSDKIDMIAATTQTQQNQIDSLVQDVIILKNKGGKLALGIFKKISMQALTAITAALLSLVAVTFFKK